MTVKVNGQPPVKPAGTVGVVSGELMRYADFVRSLYRMLGNVPDGTLLRHSCSLEPAANRNELAAHSYGDWLFFVDDDQVLLPNTLQHLLDTMYGGGYDIVAPLILRRTPPWQTVAYLHDPTVDATPFEVGNTTGIVEVEAVGSGALLVHRRVFDVLSKPYFRVGQIRSDRMQEDLEFCRRARAAGFKIALDTGCPVGHLTTMAVWPGRDIHGSQLVALVGRNGTVVPVYPADVALMAINTDLIAQLPENEDDAAVEADLLHRRTLTAQEKIIG